MAYPTERPGVTPDNPFPGLFPFTEADRPYFFGREGETAELARMARRNVTTLLFGRSGLGKTSLLHAGVFPILRDEGYLPVSVRLLYAQDAPSLSLQVYAALATAAASAGAEVDLPVPMETLGSITLWETMHRVRLWNQRNSLLTPVLAFDQFEEVFTLGASSGCAAGYIEELADLIENRVPASVRAAIMESGELPDFDYETPPCRFLLALREDFLASLEPVTNHIPSLRTNRMRLDRLNGLSAMEAVRRPAEAIIPQEVALALVRFVAAAQEDSAEVDVEAQLEGLAVEPALLSVVCRELNRTRMERDLPHITHELLAERKGAILSDLYEHTVAPLGEQVRVFIEDRLLTRGGYRTSVSLDDAIAEGAVGESEIAVLVGSRLLSIEERLGVRHVELSHDLLTALVRESRDRRHQQEAEQQRLHKEREDADRLRRRLEVEQQARLNLRRRTIQFAFAGVILATLLVCASFYAVFAMYFSLFALSNFENIEGDSLRLYQLQSEDAATEYLASVERCPLRLDSVPDWVLHARKQALFYASNLLNDYPLLAERCASNAKTYVDYFAHSGNNRLDQWALLVHEVIAMAGMTRTYEALQALDLAHLESVTATDEERDTLHVLWLLRAILEEGTGNTGACQASMKKAEEIGCSEARQASTALARMMLALNRRPEEASIAATQLRELLGKYPDVKTFAQLEYYEARLAIPEDALGIIDRSLAQTLPLLPARAALYWKTLLLSLRASIEHARGNQEPALAAWLEAEQVFKAFVEADPLKNVPAPNPSLMHGRAGALLSRALPWQVELPSAEGLKDDAPAALRAVSLGRAAYAALLAGQLEPALQKAQTAAELDACQPWLQLALAHATLFNQGVEKALPLYLACRFQDGDDCFSLQEQMLLDFTELEAAGLDKQAMDAIRQALADPANQRDFP